MPVRLLRMLPVSLPVSLFLKRAGGAKSNDVYNPDFRKACLVNEVRFDIIKISQGGQEELTDSG